MDYQFATRILASTEVDAVTYPQFLKWEMSEQAQYLRDHPGSKFGKYRDKGITELVPRAEKKRLREQRLAEQNQTQAPAPAPITDQEPPVVPQPAPATPGTLTVTERKRVRDPLEGNKTVLTLSDGSTAEISKGEAISHGGVGGWHDSDGGDYSYLADTEQEAIQELLRRRMKKQAPQATEPAPAPAVEPTPAPAPSVEPAPAAEPEATSELVGYQDAMNMVQQLKTQGWKNTATKPGHMLMRRDGSDETISMRVDPNHDWSSPTKPNVEIKRTKGAPAESEAPQVAPKPTPLVQPEPENKGEKPLQNPMQDGHGDLKAFTSELRKRGTTYRKGQWESTGRGSFRTPEGDSVQFYATTTYSKSGRLRVPSKTKYQVFLYMNVPNPENPTQLNWVTVPFAVSTGEGSVSDEKVAEGRRKAREFAEKKYGIKLGDYDFKH